MTAAAFEQSAENDRTAHRPEAPSRSNHASQWLTDHGDALWRFAVTRVSPTVAEDLVQDTLLAAIKNVSTFDGRSARETWLIGILSHKIADYYRSRARRLRAMGRIEPAHSADGPRAGAADHSQTAESDNDSDSPSETVIADGARSEFTPGGLWAIIPGDWAALSDEDLLARLKRCTQELPPILRDAIELRDMRGIPSEGVCQALGITPTNLWTRLHRARTALRRCIDADLTTGAAATPSTIEIPRETDTRGCENRGGRGGGTP